MWVFVNGSRDDATCDIIAEREHVNFPNNLAHQFVEERALRLDQVITLWIDMVNKIIVSIDCELLLGEDGRLLKQREYRRNNLPRFSNGSWDEVEV
jgi:hypothetical protein